jgi:hypothetical protein
MLRQGRRCKASFVFNAAPAIRNLTASLLALSGAAVAIFLSGSKQEWANVSFAVGAALCALVAMPRVRAGWIPVALGTVFCVLTLAAFLPTSWGAVAGWRESLPPSLSGLLAESICPQPWLSWFWWGLLVLTVFLGVVLLSTALDAERLAAFLHAVALVVGVYAVLSIYAYHSGWKYPFAGNAPFGFLPNKNHTATLLVTGAVVSFGLMQWSVAHKRRVSALLAALCSAPPLAALLFFSNSRAGVVFLAVGLLIWAIGAGRSGSRKVIWAGAGILVAFLVILFAAGGSEVRTRLAALWQEATAAEAQAEEGGEGDLDFRQPIFRDTARLIAEQPATGIGLGQFRYVFPQYRQESARAARILHPESDWLLVASESGIPATSVLLGLVVWYAVRSWRGRSGPDGLLHWTAASAVLAAVLHGVVDVPWHRPAVGWFLFVLALVAVPKSRAPLKHPAWLRVSFALGGVGVLALAFSWAKGLSNGWPPLPYRWSEYNRRLTELGHREDYEAGEMLAAEALKTYPLEKDAHYWVLAFTEASGERLDAVINEARAVDPVMPQLAVGQAVLWRGVDASREAEAWSEAVRRALVIDSLPNDADPAGAKGMVDRAMQSLRGSTAAQSELLARIGDHPVLRAYWFRSADPEAIDAWLASALDPANWLDGLPDAVRKAVLERWVTLSSAATAAAYMEARNAPAPGAYWRPLANFYAKAGDKERAVRIVAEAEGVDLGGGGGWGEGNWGRQVAELQAQGNDVAVRRLVSEAVAAKDPDAGQLAAAMAWAAERGDWETAWRAASRLVSATKKGQ